MDIELPKSQSHKTQVPVIKILIVQFTFSNLRKKIVKVWPRNCWPVKMIREKCSLTDFVILLDYVADHFRNIFRI